MNECDEECRAHRAHREAQIAGELDSTRGSRDAFKTERDTLRVQLTEARRVLRLVMAWVIAGRPYGCPVCNGLDEHAPDCALAALPAQEGWCEMNDLIARLRAAGTNKRSHTLTANIAHEAADEIIKLRGALVAMTDDRDRNADANEALEAHIQHVERELADTECALFDERTGRGLDELHTEIDRLKTALTEALRALRLLQRSRSGRCRMCDKYEGEDCNGDLCCGLASRAGRRAAMIRVLPHSGPRVESGPVQFGDDWPGVFIRGDNAMGYALALRGILDGPEDAFTRLKLRGLLRVLTACDVTQEGGDRG